MLREQKQVRQIPGEPFRRWYTNAEVDLVVWLDKQLIVGFQLTVPSTSDPTVITWHEGQGPTVAGLDDGEGRPARPKMTPVITVLQAFDRDAVLHAFREVSGSLPAGLSRLVEEKVSSIGEPDRQE